MNEQEKKAAAKSAPRKKLVPRTAPKVEPKPVLAAADPEAAAPVASVSALKARAPRKPTEVEATVAKHQKVLAEALVKAQAIKYDQPKVMKQAAAKSEKPVKAKKIKLVRDSYAMPEAEYARIGELKKRLATLGGAVKKSELLRGGIALLAALNDAELKAAMGRIERIKTGRPAKK